jgi:hypothetical protein
LAARCRTSIGYITTDRSVVAEVTGGVLMALIGGAPADKETGF